MSNKLVKRVVGDKKNLYICDPKKNKGCSGRFKDHCGIRCFCTTNPALSTDSEHPLTYEEYYRQQGKRRLLLENLLKQKKG